MLIHEAEIPPWLDAALFPFPPRRQPLEEGRMAYVDEGQGPPVLLVHGTPGWSFEFRSVLSRLSPTHRVLAPDHLGFGLSDRIPGGDYTVRGHARRLAAFVEALDLEALHLVVHDFGGPIGLGLAVDHPERVHSITVLNSWMWPLNGNPFFERARFLTGRIGSLLYRRFNFSARVLVPQAFADKERLSRVVHQHYIAAQDRAAREAAFAFARELLGAEDYLSSLWERRAAVQPKLRNVLWGMADKLLPPEQLLPRWREMCPGANFVQLEGVGHYVQEEAPERLARAIQETAP
jgi:haloalkane dehalogenase